MIDLGRLQGSIVINGVQDAVSGFGQVNNASISLMNTIKRLGTTLAIGAMFKQSIDGAKDLDKALSTLGAKTGATTEELKNMKTQMTEIYKNNLGESFDDIASAMANVSQQTEATGTELQDMTENALVLRDTFDYEINESIRSVDMMMKQFGITSEEAFNLIAQGSQQGLDKNGDLLDSINEYSVHFKQLGLDAEDMFNMLKNGTESGTFSVDKLGDAIKEFGIRVKDGSTTTNEAMQILNLNADEVAQAFAEGGETSKKAFEEVVSTLLECDNKVQQNIAGVNLFGTMWEDLGIEGIKALTDLNGSMDMTKQTMEEVSEIKYDNLDSAFQGIGRLIETEILIPFGERLLPYLNEFANWIDQNSETIVDTLGGALDKVADSITLVIDNLDTLLPTLTTVVGLFAGFKVVSTVVETVNALTVAFNSLSTVMFPIITNPYALAIIGIGTAIGSFISVVQQASEEQAHFNEILQESINLSNDFTEAKQGEEETLQEEVDKIQEYAETLAKANMCIDGYIDKNGDMAGAYRDLSGLTEEQISKLEEEAEAYDESVAIRDEVIEALEEEYGSVERAFEIQGNYKERLENISETEKLLTGAISDHDKELIKEAKQIQTTSAQVQLMIDKKRSLESQTKLNASQEKQLAQINEQLQQKLGNSCLAFDKETGTMKVNADACQIEVDAMGRVAQAKINEANVINVYSVNIQKLSADECELVIENCKRELIALEAVMEALEGSSISAEMESQRVQLNKTLNDATARLEGLNAVQPSSSGGFGGFENSAKSAGATSKEVSKSILDDINDIIEGYEYMTETELKATKDSLKKIQDENKNNKEVQTAILKAQTDICKRELEIQTQSYEEHYGENYEAVKQSLQKMLVEYEGNKEVVSNIQQTITDIAKSELDRQVELYEESDGEKYEEVKSTLEDMKAEYKDYSSVCKEIEKGITEITQAEYEDRLQEFQDTYDDMLEVIEDYYDEQEFLLDEETQALNDALQEEIDAEEQKQKEKRNKRKEERLLERIAEAEDEKERREAEQEYEDWLSEQRIDKLKEEQKLNKEINEDKKKALEEQKQNTIEIAENMALIEEEKNRLKAEGFEGTEEELTQLAIKNVEDRKNAEIDNVDELLAHLFENITQYQNLGEEISNAYLEGLKKNGDAIEDFWDQAKEGSGSSPDISNTSTTTDGSHATGLYNVPYDGYIAEVHKGEAILTKDQATTWRNNQMTGNQSQIDLSPLVNEIKTLQSIVKNQPRETQRLNNMR